MKRPRKHTKEAIRERGEVFTPTDDVNKLLDKYPQEIFAKVTDTFLDNFCGDGQILVAVLERKLSNGISLLNALDYIYGVEIDPSNAEKCRQRLLKGSTDPQLREIVDHNIICANTLDSKHPGWAKVGYMWEPGNLGIWDRFFEKMKADEEKDLTFLSNPV